MKINQDIMNTYILSSNFIKNKPGHYKHIYFNIKLYENKSGHYCNLLGSHIYPLLAWSNP